jgi:uncharacterized protein (UPF0332 family)
MNQQFNWEDFLGVANILYGSEKFREACLRSAISRAYYSVFGITKEHAIKMGFSPKKTGVDHKELREFLIKKAEALRSSDKTISDKLVRIANNIKTLHNLRKNADYDILFPNDIVIKTKNAIKEAEIIIRFFQNAVIP